MPVQDASSDSDSTEPTFAMLSCAHGAESLVKSDVARDGWRLAFSRPGFVTCKHDQRRGLPSGIFIRTASHSLHQARDVDGERLIAGVIDKLQSLDASIRFDQVHVWPRDRAPIGRFDFEPGADEVTRAVADAFMLRCRSTNSIEHRLMCDRANQVARPGEQVLDIVLVEPSQWFVGMHQVSRTPSMWPGAVQPIELEQPPISRAYFKAAEAIAWSGWDMRPGDKAVEVGSAPGGACMRMLEMGMHVLGIDPAEMAPSILEHPRFQHIRARAGDLPRRTFAGAKWMFVDSNVKPEATLSTVRHIVMSRETAFNGLLITMKLGQYDRADQIPRWRDEIQRWGPERIEIRQLARNRCEVCFAVTMPASRVKR
ncbi:MAG: SAM-dependent methyltransferase [Planctomycetota bacterium]